MILETCRLRVRELEASDFDRLHAILGDTEVMRYVGDLNPYTEDQTQHAIEICRESYRLNGFGAWAIISKQENQLIGMGGIEVSPFREMAEVSYVFAARCWGQGLATEFARAVIDYGFRCCGLSEIGASFDPENRASMRVAEKAGMRFLRKGTDEYDLPTIFYVIHKPVE
ncbi:MAG TPA: GNAT family N-acetyltransferase [Blastocatellia bacterium]|jgi:RimJ/RimL family protein N-acetyltransferase